MSDKPSIPLIDNPLLRPLQDFLVGMEAVRELTSFATANAKGLDDEASAIEALASSRLPGADPVSHREAIAVVRAALNQVTDLGKANAESETKVSSGDLDAQFGAILSAADAKVQEATGDPRAFPHYVRAWIETKSRPQRLPLLYSSLLTTAVSNFEVLVAGLVRGFLVLRPQALAGQEAKYTFKDIQPYESMQEFREFAADRYAESLLHGGLDDWMAWFEKQLQIKLEEIARSSFAVREVFQRRHLFVHNAGRVSRLYLLKLPDLKDPPGVNDQLLIDEEYCLTAIDELTIAGILLASRSMVKLIQKDANGEHPADNIVSHESYKALTLERHHVVISLTERQIPICTSDYEKLILQVNRWVALKRTEGLGRIRAEVEGWQTASLHARFQLAKAALLDQVAEAAVLAENLRASGELSIEDWLTWPLLSGVRAHVASTI